MLLNDWGLHSVTDSSRMMYAFLPGRTLATLGVWLIRLDGLCWHQVGCDAEHCPEPKAFYFTFDCHCGHNDCLSSDSLYYFKLNHPMK